MADEQRIPWYRRQPRQTAVRSVDAKADKSQSYQLHGEFTITPNPHTHPAVVRRLSRLGRRSDMPFVGNTSNGGSGGFFGKDVNQFLAGWEQTTHTIDYFLESELTQLRARSRSIVRMGGYGKRFVNLMRSNIVGPHGVTVQAQTMRTVNGVRQLDDAANEALEAAFRDWCADHCDYLGTMSFVDMQKMAVACAAQDGEFIFEIQRGRHAGKYSFQMKAIDPELLDVSKNTEFKDGRHIRMGVEYDKAGRRSRYHFREKAMNRDYSGGYSTGRSYTVEAKHIIHGFLHEWPDQSRGIPWMHASLTDAKHLDKYKEAAIINARGTAGVMVALKSANSDQYTGDGAGEDAGGYSDAMFDGYDPGTIKDFGDRDVVNIDPNYPHQMFADFVKTNLQGIASGLDVSYHALSGDLEGVSYSSARVGVLEDREAFKSLQEWLISSLVRPVYQHWLEAALISGQIRINGRRPMRSLSEYLPASYQGRRWAWVDPQKDGLANQLAIENRTKSRSQVIREQGGDPETLFREIQREEKLLASLGISPMATEATVEALGNDSDQPQEGS